MAEERVPLTAAQHRVIAPRVERLLDLQEAAERECRLLDEMLRLIEPEAGATFDAGALEFVLTTEEETDDAEHQE